MSVLLGHARIRFNASLLIPLIHRVLPAALLLMLSLFATMPAKAEISCVYSTTGGIDCNDDSSPNYGQGGSFVLSYSGCSAGDVVLVSVCGWYYNFPPPGYFGPPTVTSTGGTVSAISGGAVSHNSGANGIRLDTYEMTATGSSGSITVAVEGYSVATATLSVYSGSSGIDAVGSGLDYSFPADPSATVTTVSDDDLVVGFLGEEDSSEPVDEPGTGFTYIDGSQEAPDTAFEVMTSCENSNSQSYSGGTHVTASFSDPLTFWFAVAVALAPS